MPIACRTLLTKLFPWNGLVTHSLNGERPLVGHRPYSVASSTTGGAVSASAPSDPGAR